MNRDKWRKAIRIATAGLMCAAVLHPGLAASATNTAPTISGTPAASVQATRPYTFTPAARDAQNNPLTFSISNKPGWASFSSTSGKLSGTPTSAQKGKYSNIVIRVSDGSLSSALPAFSIAVGDAPNTPPVISGLPATAVITGAAYSFAPKASDPDGNPLAFSISGKPSWATFTTATGTLTGKAQAGTYSNVVISVSDGTASRSLPAFTITVGAAASTNTGTASLTWIAPTRNADGSALTNLVGYRVYYGTSSSRFSQVIELTGSHNTTYAFTQLARGTHYFAVASFNSAGAESEMSAVGSKTIQ